MYSWPRLIGGVQMVNSGQISRLSPDDIKVIQETILWHAEIPASPAHGRLPLNRTALRQPEHLLYFESNPLTLLRGRDSSASDPKRLGPMARYVRAAPSGLDPLNDGGIRRFDAEAKLVSTRSFGG
jgi:hypothetical protein